MQSVPVPVPVALPSPVPVPSVFVVVEPPFLSVHWVSKVQIFSKQLELEDLEDELMWRSDELEEELDEDLDELLEDKLKWRGDELEEEPDE